MPFTNLFNYQTNHGTVKHFYGFTYALGGIVSLTGADFEATNGYPNFWGWGMEDNVLQNRCTNKNIKIDRSNFFAIGNPNILHLFDGIQRVINRKDPWRATHDNGLDGLLTIHKLEYTINVESLNPLDNIHTIDSNNMFMINIKTFMTGIKFESESYHKYDLREPPRKIIHPSKIKDVKLNEQSNDDWSNIPFYPTIEKKKEMINKYGAKEADKIIQYSYENSTDPTKEVLPPKHHNNLQSNNNNNNNNTQILLNKIRMYNETMRQNNLSHRIIPPNINKYSPTYSKLIASKPRATASANIKLGGVY